MHAFTIGEVESNSCRQLWRLLLTIRRMFREKCASTAVTLRGGPL